MSAIRTIGLGALACVLGFSDAAPARAQAGDANTTYRVILYLADNGEFREVSLRRLDEVWTEEEGVDRLRELLSAREVRRLEDVTILSGRDTPALRVRDVTVRVRGVYRQPDRDSMFLRVEMEGGADTLVKELISSFDETIVLAYPLTEGDRSIVALILPTRLDS